MSKSISAREGNMSLSNYTNQLEGNARYKAMTEAGNKPPIQRAKTTGRKQ